MSTRHGLTLDLPSPSDTRRRSIPATSCQHVSCATVVGGTNGAPLTGEQVISPECEEHPVTSLPLAVPSAPLGIVIKSGAPAPKPVRFWAYLWATDDEDTMEQHWHQRVPAEHAA